jgi:transposase
MAVMVGVDPHKRSHTALAIDRDEVQLGTIEVGYLLAQQLVAAGEHVVDVPATLAARVRLLASSRSNKNDPNDGYSIAVAALHAPRFTPVARADHANVLRLLAKRHRELASARTRTVCRLHALLVELVPGGITKEIRGCPMVCV